MQNENLENKDGNAADIENTTDDVTIDDEAAPQGETENIDDETEDGADSAKKTADEDEDEEFVVSLSDDEDPDDDDNDDDEGGKSGDSAVIRDMRKKLKDAQRRNKELERKQKAAQPEAKLPELGEKPKLEDFDFDDDKFTEALEGYLEKKRVHDAKAKEIEAEEQEQQKHYDDKLTSYQSSKAEIVTTRPDFDDAEITVMEALDRTKQGVFVTVADNPAVLVLALGKYPKRLEKLAAIKDPILFAKEVVKLEGSLSVKGKASSKSQPERRVKRGNASPAGSSDTTLAQLEAEADRTGDRTKVQAHKRQLKKAAQ